METKIIEILQSEILANRKAMLSNAEKLDQLVKAVKEETALEGTDLISRTKAQETYDLSRSYIDSLVEEGWLTAYKIPGRRKVYLKRSQIDSIFKAQ